MKKYKYKNRIVTASTRKEAISKITATTLDIKSSKDITDEIILEYGIDFLCGKDGEVFNMDDLDSNLGATEAIKLALIGHDYPEVESDFNVHCDLYTFYKRNGGLMSIRNDKLLDYLKNEINNYDLFDYLDNLGYIEHDEE